jgi:hypothetical protein
MNFQYLNKLKANMNFNLKKSGYPYLLGKEDRQLKCTKFSKKKPSGESSTGYTAFACSCLEATS